MDDPSPSLQPIQSTNFIVNDSNLAVAKPIRKKKRVSEDGSALTIPAEKPDLCSSSSSTSSRKVVRTALRRRNPKIILGGGRRSGTDVEAIALPLGMSFAAVIAQVIEKSEASDRMSVDHLSMICTSAVKESLANVFGDKFDCFVKNFEKSFGSTLKTLRLINETSVNGEVRHSCRHNATVTKSNATSSGDCMNREGCYTSNYAVKDCRSEVDCRKRKIHMHDQKDSAEKKGYFAESSTSNAGLNEKGCMNKEGSASSVLEDCRPSFSFPANMRLSTKEDVQENLPTDPANMELALHGQMDRRVSVSADSLGSMTAFNAFEKSVMEQTRSNDLKTFELGISMRRLKLKETQLALNYESNHLERSKLVMGASKASFKAEKFKSQLEETRYSELHRKCIDLLVAGLFIMSVSLAYGAYVFSFRRIADATSACTPSDKESKSWWMPKAMMSFNSGLQILRCQFQVMAQMVFGILMILLVAFLLLQRTTTLKDSKPVTFILLLLGVFCGFAGKVCVDTLGGSGNHWLLYWEVQCILHFLSNVCTPALFFILHGPINVSQETKSKPMFPYWSRRAMFYATVLLFLPLFCGLTPFASVGEWKAHFSELSTDSESY